MVSESQANTLALHWVKAWNSHDLNQIMSHYVEDVILVSPVAAKILDDPSGTVKGKKRYKNISRRDLKFTLI